MSYTENIRDLFSPDDKTIKYFYEKYPQIKENETLSIHVRLGDYKNFPNIHPTISTSYINESLKHLPKPNHIFIFSDDKNWVYNNLKFDSFTVVNEEDYIEMWLMSLCKNNILSNSSFSWWASFLNKNLEKIVISPSIWFGDSGPKFYDDIFEKNWIKIKVKNKNGELIY